VSGRWDFLREVALHVTQLTTDEPQHSHTHTAVAVTSTRIAATVPVGSNRNGPGLRTPMHPPLPRPTLPENLHPILMILLLLVKIWFRGFVPLDLDLNHSLAK
jgi:hypothetical protein